MPAVQHPPLIKLLWSGDPKKHGYCRTKLAVASLSRRWGGLGVPNIQPIIDAHHLRMWAVGMNSDEDWGWAVRSDVEIVLRASNLSHPLDHLSTKLKLSQNDSLTAVIIQTLRRHIPSRMYMRPDDLCKLPDDCVEAILHECPFLTRPENQDDGLPVITEYTHITGEQTTPPTRVVPDYNLVYATRNNVSRPNNTTVHNEHGRSLATSTSIQGFIKTSKIPVNESEDLTQLVI